MKYLGYPYAAVGNSPSTGFSCIGFASYVYRQNGIPLPGDLQSAFAYAPKVAFSDLLPGDLLFFQNTVWPGISHVAIYIGGGKFIHAEWYNRGVVITSFYNDSVDGNYWPGKYLGANRPWTGAAIGAAIPNPPSSGAAAAPATSVPGAQTQTTVPNGPAGVVYNADGGLKVHSAPSKSAAVLTVIQQGTTVYIVGKTNGWYKVQLSDGTVGWVAAQYVNTGSGSATVSNPTAPPAAGSPAKAKKPATVSVRPGSLNVRSSPSSSAPVVGAVSQGQHLVVIAYEHGWYEVRLPDGSIGWVKGTYVKGGAHKPASSATKTGSTVKAPVFKGGNTAAAALNVRSGPSLSSSVITVIPVGGSYQIIAWSNGWAKVQLPNGTVGWVSGTVIGTGTSSSPTYASRSNSKAGSRSTARSARVTATVRVHLGPSLGSAVVGMIAAGSKVKVLAHRSGWTLIRSSSGITGYVLGSFVH